MLLEISLPVLARDHGGAAPQGGTGKGKRGALCCLPYRVPHAPCAPCHSRDPGAPADSEPPPAAPDLPVPQRPWPGLDHLGAIQAVDGLILGLNALFTSYDHITLAGRTLQLQQQWGTPFIAASLAAVFIDAQLATGSRLRAARDAIRAAQDSARAEDGAARERDRADRERNRAAEARERQTESFKRLDQAALLSGRFQLNPTPTNRARFQFFLTLIADASSPDLEG